MTDKDILCTVLKIANTKSLRGVEVRRELHVTVYDGEADEKEILNALQQAYPDEVFNVTVSNHPMPRSRGDVLWHR